MAPTGRKAEQMLRRSSKNAAYFGKNCEKSYVRGHGRFEVKGRPLTKINITFFVGNEILNIFY